MLSDLVQTDKRTAGKIAWVIYAFCAFMMSVMAYFKHWPIWLTLIMLGMMVALTVLTFHSKASPFHQSVFMMLCPFTDVLMISVVENNLYSMLYAFLGVAIVLAVSAWKRLPSSAAKRTNITRPCLSSP